MQVAESALRPEGALLIAHTLRRAVLLDPTSREPVLHALRLLRSRADRPWTFGAGSVAAQVLESTDAPLDCLIAAAQSARLLHRFLSDGPDYSDSRVCAPEREEQRLLLVFSFCEATLGSFQLSRK